MEFSGVTEAQCRLRLRTMLMGFALAGEEDLRLAKI
jgi:hypothetical protein